MKINVKLIGHLQTGQFKQMARTYPVATRVQTIIDDLQLPQLLIGIVLINGVHAGDEDILGEGDNLVILPLLGGG